MSRNNNINTIFEVRYYGGIKIEVYNQIINQSLQIKPELKLSSFRDVLFYRNSKLSLKKAIVVKIINEKLYIFGIDKHNNVASYYQLPEKYANCLNERLEKYDPSKCSYGNIRTYLKGNAKELKEFYMYLKKEHNYDVLLKITENTFMISPNNEFDSINKVIDFSNY